MPSLAEHIASVMKAGGIERIFGIPGGGSSLDLMEAARTADIPFVVTRTEAAATVMAAVTGEITGAPGAALVGVGPGASSATNGLAYAYVERSPMLLFADGPASSAHQHFDQQALYRPITKTTAHLRGERAVETFVAAWRQVVSPPEGPAMFEFTATEAAEATADTDAPVDLSRQISSSPDFDDELAALLRAARKPLAIIGLEARHHAESVRAVIDRFGIPCVSTYKALGTVASEQRWCIGPVTGAIGENPLYADADLVIGIGFDPIEFIPGTWTSDLPPVVLLTEAEISNRRVPLAAGAIGDLSSLLETLADVFTTSDWTNEDIDRKRIQSRQMYEPRGTAFSCAAAVQVIAETMPKGTRVACDAGAHMFATLGLWPANAAFDVLKSNGLSTMGYALPAAIAAKLCDPSKSTIAITGDGGLSMCLGELATVREMGLDLTVIVMNDAALSLIDIKQQRQQRPPTGVRYPLIDYAKIAAAFGWASGTVNDADGLRRALQKPGAKLIDVRIDPAGYGEDLARLRG